MKFVCKKCGRKFWEMPKSHGVCFMGFYPFKQKPSEMCDGEVVPIKSEGNER